MSECKHNEGVDVFLTHNFLEDVGRYTADIRIVCQKCQTPFRFLGLPIGLDLTGAAVSPDGTEGRFSLMPGREPPPPIDGVQGFGVKFHRAEKPCAGHRGERDPRPAEAFGPPCCDRAGEYNGFGSDGPTLFTCPKGCSCHD